ncbi:DUF5721 family protein [Clostridium sp. Marseille-P2415]|uniref:DUF5721 family protein n=1 Tax=Clostridium sp. Marseille-P2415 TaxID=1805471 RepID=UPI00098836A4|nr:DUF5721 family protein [Clostridium sp. Marseille-P2415]
MIALRIEDIKPFTSKLFVGEVFDRFLVKEASISTFNTFTIDGTIRPGYYSREEIEEKKIGDLSAWAMMKPFCFSLIKGKKLPGCFRIIMQLPKDGAERFLAARQIPLMPDQVKGLYVNIRYEEERLTCITGTSVSIFTLDKTLDEEWDQAFKAFLKQNEISFLEE